MDGPNGKEIVYKSGDVDRKAIIIKKPEARYSQKARDRGISGMVVVSMVLSASGQVTNLRIVRGVPELNETAIDAAKRLEFEPAIKDGKPVATRVSVEYRYISTGGLLKRLRTTKLTEPSRSKANRVVFIG